MVIRLTLVTVNTEQFLSDKRILLDHLGCLGNGPWAKRTCW